MLDIWFYTEKLDSLWTVFHIREEYFFFAYDTEDVCLGFHKLKPNCII